MPSLDSFLMYLKNVKESGKTEVTVDVDFLLGVLGVQEMPQTPKKPIASEVEVDGGKF
jgi:hypothetical protein